MVDNGVRYHLFMITDFRCMDTQASMSGKLVARFATIEIAAMRKLVQLNAATSLESFAHSARQPP